MTDTSPHETHTNAGRHGIPHQITDNAAPDIGRTVALHRRGRTTLLAMPADVPWRPDEGAHPDTGVVALRAVRPHPPPRQAAGGVMLKFQWNALRRGDTVFVHDPSDADLGLRAGIVTLIDVGPRGPDVGIRLTTGSPTAPVIDPEGSPSTSRPWMTTTAGVAATTAPSDPTRRSAQTWLSPAGYFGFQPKLIGDPGSSSVVAAPNNDAFPVVLGLPALAASFDRTSTRDRRLLSTRAHRFGPAAQCRTQAGPAADRR